MHVIIAEPERKKGAMKTDPDNDLTERLLQKDDTAMEVDTDDDLTQKLKQKDNKPSTYGALQSASSCELRARSDEERVFDRYDIDAF